MQSLRQSFQDMGMRSIPDLHDAIERDLVHYEVRSPSAQREGSVHGLLAYQEPVIGFREESSRT
jgi:IMP dehydrogenase